ncbi:hypothetical protein GYMLUDRAFT_207148 [Collybiopsis luxurians FD-317 M1]|uniref:Unplaced genomic scaffold GYMLUscaffold_75, whole genome shotgun sequence n=1 Tax=Collybiopsis luxurians FD-317 M1 TaxID=944289 RepID=A0A0D0C7H4_9AGAR|nr:hypothetical protein GYMLUDRAFT_207148 [Collybiopsis luxurians FD-317 M1]
MKLFTSVLSAFSFGSVALGQFVQIGAPTNMTSVIPGGPISVRIDRPNFQSSALEIALVIGISTCGTGPCPGPVDGVIGTILYNGPYNPQQPPDSTIPPLPPHQYFNGTVPDFLPSGYAQLTVAHFSLVGAANGPLFETLSEVLVVA